MKPFLSTFIIAEAGVNHNGSLEMARQLIDAAVEAQADAVKFQTFKAEKVISRLAPKAEYQKETTGSCESQLDMAKKLELDYGAFEALMMYCGKRGIEFMSTPFDLDSLDFLAGTLGVPRLKIPSGEITNAPLLFRAALSKLPIILSTGMSTLGEVETALSILAFGYVGSKRVPFSDIFRETYHSTEGQKALKEKVTLLHCTTEYPAPFSDTNLRAMDTLRHSFGLGVGFSDHTEGIVMPIAAVARGAAVIEKHFTLDRNLPGPDHKASLTPDELMAMVKFIRQTEMAMGNGLKIPAASELKNISIARKSLVAASKITKGEHFSEHNLTVKRPGTGVSPIYYWDWLGKISDKDYQTDQLIDPF